MGTKRRVAEPPRPLLGVVGDGRRIAGVRVNEDTFTVQIRKPDQAFALFEKSETKEVIHETKSMMPAYNHLSAADLQNLLAYLSTRSRDL